MANIILRSLHPDDLNAVVLIDGDITGRSRRKFFEKRLQVTLELPETLVACAAVTEDKLIGYCFVRVEDGAFGIAGQVGAVDVVGVCLDYQKAGVGMLMMEEIERRLLARSIGLIRTSIDWSDTSLVGYFSAAGFALAPSLVLSRHCEAQPSFAEGDPESPRDFDGAARDYTPLLRDTLPARSMEERDLSSIVRIDSKLTDRDRTAFYQAKMQEVLNESGIRVSLVVEQNSAVIGYAMARLDYGDFGQVEPSAVLDTIGVHPDYAGQGVGRALLSQLLGNLAALQVTSIHTQLQWDSVALLEFLANCGFAPTQNLVLSKSIA
ncbi:MAG: GNAT family N-acetyltransferase [Halieaceae bacterium]|jgi:ribosomal protein S18 acetylase RimI-like enzyme|nr:GNAT family N-acetyltransferase [Halieaceae bacterium]